MKPTLKQLMEFGPCAESLDFLKQSKTLRRAWKTCKRADWMLWALSKFGMIDELWARGFACDCAEHVLHFYEGKYPDDKRPRLAIEASRRTITDQSEEALNARAAAASAAAWAAARAAAWDAARAAAWDAARAAAWDAARAAAWAAAWAAASAAASAAARAAASATVSAAARHAENEWQANRLREVFNPFDRK